MHAVCFPSLFSNGDVETARFPPLRCCPRCVCMLCTSCSEVSMPPSAYFEKPSGATSCTSIHPLFFSHHYFFLRPDEISQALLNGFRPLGSPSEPSVRATGSGTFIQLQLQGRTRFNDSLCSTAIERSAFQPRARPQ